MLKKKYCKLKKLGICVACRKKKKNKGVYCNKCTERKLYHKKGGFVGVSARRAAQIELLKKYNKFIIVEKL